MRAVLTAAMFSGGQALLIPLGGFFLRAEPLSSKLRIHVLMA
jgi:hypothetical protein